MLELPTHLSIDDFGIPVILMTRNQRHSIAASRFTFLAIVSLGSILATNACPLLDSTLFSSEISPTKRRAITMVMFERPSASSNVLPRTFSFKS